MTQDDQAKAQAGILSSLEVLVEGTDRPVLSFGEDIDGLGHKALPALLLVCAAVNVVPAPPGLSAILGIPLVLLSLQRVLGFGVHVPAWMRRKSIQRTTAQRMLDRARPWIRAAEERLRHRWASLTSDRVRPALDWIILALALTVLIPFPFTAMLPAFSVCLISFGLLEKDGIFVAVGCALGTVALMVIASIFYGLGLAVGHLFGVA